MDNQQWLAFAFIILGLVYSSHNYFEHDRNKLKFFYESCIVASFPFFVLYHNALLSYVALAAILLSVIHDRKSKSKKK